MKNYFQFYDLPISPEIDINILKAKFINNSRNYHPDKHVLADDKIKAESEDLAAYNNKAYYTLANRDKRINYLLSLKDLIKEEETHAFDPEFLMEMMDINDLLTEDSTLAKSKIAILESELEAVIRPIFNGYDDEKVDTETLFVIRDFYYKRKYLARLKEEKID